MFRRYDVRKKRSVNVLARLREVESTTGVLSLDCTTVTRLGAAVRFAAAAGDTSPETGMAVAAEEQRLDCAPNTNIPNGAAGGGSMDGAEIKVVVDDDVASGAPIEANSGGKGSIEGMAYEAELAFEDKPGSS